MFLLPTLLKTTKCTGTHTHIYTSPQEIAQSFSFGFHFWKMIREKSVFILNHTMSFPNWLLLLPSFLIWPTAVTSIQVISHTSPIKAYCRFSWLQDHLACFCVHDQQWDLVFQVLHKFWLRFVKSFLADRQSTNDPFQDGSTCWWFVPEPFSSLTVIHTAIISAGFSLLPYTSPWSTACLLLLGSVSVTATSASSP